jgi:PAS domain S-box-containing protein
MTKTFNSDFLKGGGKMGAAIRSKDWSRTSIGDLESWPQSLKTTLSIILHSRFPMFLWWGPELLCFYNDAYRPSLGKEGKHPFILGMPAEQAWPEIWTIIKPLIDQVLQKGEATWSEDQLIPIYRNNTLEDVYWTFSYSPVYDESDQRMGVFVTCHETTEKVRIYKETKEREEQLHFTIEAAGLGTWDYNPLTNLFTANQRLREWHEFPNDGPIKLDSALEIIVPDDRPGLINSIKEALNINSSKPFDETYTIVNPENKQKRVVRAKGKAHFNQENIAYRFNGTLDDITEEIKFRLFIQESAQTFKNLIEHAPVAMCVFKGPEFIVEIANEKMISLWGKTPEQVMRKPVFECLPEARTQGLEVLLEEVYKTGEPYIAHERVVHLPRNGRIESAFINFVYEALRSGDGEISGIVAVATDVTEQVLTRKKIEEAEERVRLAVEAGNLGAFDFNPVTNEAIISPRLREIFNLPETVSWTDIIEKIHPEDRMIRDTAFQQALITGVLFYEVRIIYDVETIHWIRAQGKMFYNEKNEAFRVLGTMMDITENKIADQKREEYIAIASHELRNPLSSLNLSLELLESSTDPGENGFYISKALSQVKRLLMMTNELLNVSKISSGILDLKPEVCNVRDILTESLNTFQAGKNINKITISGNTDITIKADKFRLEQVLINLLSNASKYSPGGEEIQIDIKEEDEFIKIAVKDKGMGIDQDKLPFLFKKFIRIDQHSNKSGYGLGLYISEQIVRKHGGAMGVTSIKGNGSVFWFTIPR